MGLLLAWGAYSQRNLAGGELTYKHIEGLDYEVTLTLYRDCNNPLVLPNTQAIIVSSSCSAQSTAESLPAVGSIVIPACPSGTPKCSGGSVPSVEKKVYSKVIRLNFKCQDYRFSYSGNFRSNSRMGVTLPTGVNSSLYLEALLNNSGQLTNSSPTFSSDHLRYVFDQKKTLYNPGATDPDGDVLSYSLIAPKTSAGGNLGYLSGYSATKPFPLVGASIGTNTLGDMQFTPDLASQPAASVSGMAILIEERRNGVLVGTSIRDMTVELIPSTATNIPFLTGINGGTDSIITVCENQLVNFQLIGSGTAVGGNLNLTLEDGGLGASMIRTPTAGSISGEVFFVPTSPGRKILTFTLGNGSCPVEGIFRKTIIVDVNQAPKIAFSVNGTPVLNTPKVFTLQHCGFSSLISTTITGASGNYGYSWTPFANTSSITVLQAGVYPLVVKDMVNTCESTDTITLRNIIDGSWAYIPFNVTDSVCVGQPSKFNSFLFISSNTDRITSLIWSIAPPGSNQYTVVKTSNVASQNSTAPRDTLSYTFTSPGVYSISLKAISLNGCEYTEYENVRARDFPAINFSFLTRCVEPGFISISNLTSVAGAVDQQNLIHNWYIPVIPDVNPAEIVNSEKDPQILFPNTTNGVNLTYTARNGRCASRRTVNTVVNPRPMFTYVTPNFAPICSIAGYPNLTLSVAGVAVGPAAASSTGVSFKWLSGSTNSTQTIVDPRTSYSESVAIHDVFGCRNDSTVTIEDALVTNFRFLQYYCPPLPGSVQGSTSTQVVVEDVSSVRGFNLGTYQQYVWDFQNGQAISCSGANCHTLTGYVSSAPGLASIQNTGSGTISNRVFSPSYSSAVEATYPIRLYIQDHSNCQDTLVYEAIVKTVNGTGFAIKSNGISNPEICFETVPNYVSVKGNNINRWTWNIDNQRIVSKTNPYTQTVPGFPNPIQLTTDGYNLDSDNGSPFEAKFKFDTLMRGIKTLTTFNIYHIINYNEGNSSGGGGGDGCVATFSGTVQVRPELKYEIDTSYNRCGGLPTTLKANRISGLFSVTTFNWSLEQEFSAGDDFNPEFFQKEKLPFTSDSSSLFAVITTSGLNSNTPFTKTEATTAGTAIDPIFAYLQVEDTKGCKGVDTLSVNNLVVGNGSNPSLNINLTPPSIESCNQIGANAFTLEGNTSYIDQNPVNTWDFGDGNKQLGSILSPYYEYKNLASGYTITFTGKDAAGWGCNFYAFAKVNIKQAPEPNFTTSAPILCIGDVLTIQPNVVIPTGSSLSITTLNWNFGNGTTESYTASNDLRTVPYSTAGVYTITAIARDTSACVDTAYALVDVKSKPIARFSYTSEADPSDINPRTLGQNVYVDTDVYLTDNSQVENLPSIVRKWYWYKDSLILGNEAKDRFTVRFPKDTIVKVSLVIENSKSCSSRVDTTFDLRTYVENFPNAFNPNSNDAKNKTFLPFINGVREIIDFQVYNRMGQVVYSIKEKKGLEIKGWDGTYNSTEQPVGVYVWYIKAKTGKDETKEKTGTVTLVR